MDKKAKEAEAKGAEADKADTKKADAKKGKKKMGAMKPRGAREEEQVPKLKKSLVKEDNKKMSKEELKQACDAAEEFANSLT